jgi:hypothetical protein
MARGGARPGAGRPPGAKTKTCSSAELARWCEASGQVGLPLQLRHVSEDPAAPVEVRLQALRSLFALFAAPILAMRLAKEAQP